LTRAVEVKAPLKAIEKERDLLHDLPIFMVLWLQLANEHPDGGEVVRRAGRGPPCHGCCTSQPAGIPHGPEDIVVNGEQVALADHEPPRRKEAGELAAIRERHCLNIRREDHDFVADRGGIPLSLLP
jgi:hypothetical protein